jgi:hypothetical protein
MAMEVDDMLDDKLRHVAAWMVVDIVMEQQDVGRIQDDTEQEEEAVDGDEHDDDEPVDMVGMGHAVNVVVVVVGNYLNVVWGRVYDH